GGRITFASHRLVPAANGIDSKLGGVVIDADTHTADIRCNVVDTVGNAFAKFLVDEVMHIDLVGTALRSIVAACVLVRADQFLLLGIDRDHRLAGGLERDDLPVDVFEMSGAVGMMAAFLGLAIDLPTIAKAFQKFGDAARRYLNNATRLPAASPTCSGRRTETSTPSLALASG